MWLAADSKNSYDSSKLPWGFKIFTDNIDDYLNNLCSWIMKASHTHLCLWLAISHNISLALPSKQCKYSKMPSSSKSHHHHRTKSNSKTVLTRNHMVPDVPPSSASNLGSLITATSLLPPAAVYTRFIIPQWLVLFSGQEVRYTQLIEMLLLVRQSLIYSRNPKVHFFTINSDTLSTSKTF